MFQTKSLIFALAAGVMMSSIQAQTDTQNQTPVTTQTMTSTQTTASDASQMQPPPAVQNKVFDSLVGEWKGESDMMGKKMKDKIKIDWGINHQFLIMKLKSKGINDKAQYQGLGIFGFDPQNNVKTWWFDSWGANSVSTGQGSISGNKITIQDGNDMFKETRSLEVQGDKLIMHAKGSMKMNGQEKTFDQTTIYKKD